jgi:hypothetical protein
MEVNSTDTTWCTRQAFTIFIIYRSHILIIQIVETSGIIRWTIRPLYPRNRSMAREVLATIEKMVIFKH